MQARWPDEDLRALTHSGRSYRAAGLSTLTTYEKQERTALTFREFVDRVNPRYVWYKHCVILAEALQRVADGQCTRLMVFMPPRHGKCMAKGSRVLMADGQLDSIENLRPSDMVISIDSCYNTTVSPVVAITENGEKPVFKITLQSGRTIVCTDNHPLLTVLGWREAGMLKAGDSIAAIRKAPMPDGDPLPFGFAALMGYITGDGSYAKGEPIVTASDPETISHLQEIADAHGWKLTRDGKYGYHIRSERGKRDGSTAKERLREYMTPAKSAQKRVPDVIFQAGKADLCAFLAAYFNCDGTVTGQREGVAEYYSTSIGLLQDVQHLLTRLGIYSTLRKKNGRYKGQVHISWRLSVSGQDLVKMAEELPAIGDRGRKLREVAEKCKAKNHYPEYESIPPDWKKLRTTKINLRAQGLRVDKTYTRGTARPLVERVAEIEDNDALRRLCSPDLIWERIVSIESMGTEPTYDIEVKDTHNFIVENTVVHNSELVSRLFAAYYLYRNPERWIGMNCYGADLAYGMSRNARENYQRAGAVLSNDAWAARHWETGYGGGMWAAGVGGPITGKGFHLGIIDDPLKNAEDAQSPKIRQTQKDWIGTTFGTREEPGGAIILVQTRWHNDDAAGYWLGMEEEEPEHWHIVRLEAIKEDVDYDAIPATCTLEPDFRKPGEALCPERYSIAKLRKMERRIGDYYFGALYQQRPQPASGAIFKREWWDREQNRYDGADRAHRNRVVARWIVYDTALKDGAGNDYSAAAVWELWPDYRLAIRHMWNERIQSALLPERMEADAVEWNKDGKLRGLVIEDKGSGTNAIQTLRMAAPQWLADMIFEFMPTGTKTYRARLASIWCERNCILLPTPSIQNGDWYNALLDANTGQLWLFPHAAHDDLVDTVTSGIMFLEHYIKEGWDLRQLAPAA